MASMGEQMGAKRIIRGVRVSHPIGTPGLAEAADMAARREIVKVALEALQKDVSVPTVFETAVIFK